MSDDDDPFEKLGDASDREGDPFDRLAPDDESDDEDDTDGDSQHDDTGSEFSDSEGATTGGGNGQDPFADLGEPPDDTVDGDSDGDAEGADPFADLGPGDPDRDPIGVESDGETTDLGDDGESTSRESDGQPDAFGVEPASGDGADSSNDGWFEGQMGSTGTGGAEAGDATGAGTEPDEPFPGSSGQTGDPFDEAESVFEDRGVEEVDPDAVWEQLGPSQDSGGDAEGRSYAEVSKHRYCEQCEFFSAPPDISCRHEGTEILEFLDMETVRVVDCPVVAERRVLGNQE